MKHARLIMNPISGTDDEPNLMKLPDIIATLEAANIRTDLAFTKPDESPKLIAQRAIAEGYDMVIVGGGDGTVSEVAEGMIHAPIPLGILPIGTYNNIARSLNLPTNIVEACQVLVQGQVKSIDVGQANGEHFFFEAAGIGLDAALFPLGEEIKGGRWGRLLQMFHLAVQYQPQPMQIELDRPIVQARIRPPVRKHFLQRRTSAPGKFRIKALLVVVANAPYYGAGFTVAPDANVHDSLLTITIYRKFSKWELVRHFWSISRGQYHYDPKIETYQASAVRITSPKKLPVHIDGQPLGELPVSFRVVNQALKVMVPAIDTPTYQRQDDPNPPIVLPVEGTT